MIIFKLALRVFFCFFIFQLPFYLLKASQIEDLDPNNLYSGRFQQIAPDDLEKINREALTEKLSKKPGFIEKFRFAAQHGSSFSMFHLGLICEKESHFDLARKWYILSFQNQWFQDPEKAYPSPAHTALAYTALQNLSQYFEKDFLKFFFSVHPKEFQSNGIVRVLTLREKYGRYEALASFYEVGIVEPYLSEAENRDKILWLTRECQKIANKVPNEIKTMINAFHSSHQMIEEHKLYEDAKFFIERNLFSFPPALHSLGWMYEEGYVGEKEGAIDFDKAAQFYRSAATPSSYTNLGRLYKNGKVGLLADNFRDYDRASYYLEHSGLPEAFQNLALLYRDGHVGASPDGTPNIKKAKEYFEKAGKFGYGYIAELYTEGYILNADGEFDYETAKTYLLQAVKAGDQTAQLKLGFLYSSGKFLDEDRHSKAEKYFLNVLNKSTDQSILSMTNHNLARLYTDIGEFEKAAGFYQSAGRVESFFNLALLNEHKFKQYDEALKYYNLANTARSWLGVLGLYQLKLIACSAEDVKESVQKINDLINEVSLEEHFYIKGVAEYYLGNWEESLAALDGALYFGSQEEELQGLMQELEDYLNKNGDAVPNAGVEDFQEESPLQEERVSLLSGKSQVKHIRAIMAKPIHKSSTPKSSIKTEKNIKNVISCVQKKDFNSLKQKHQELLNSIASNNSVDEDNTLKFLFTLDDYIEVKQRNNKYHVSIKNADLRKVLSSSEHTIGSHLAHSHVKARAHECLDPRFSKKLFKLLSYVISGGCFVESGF